MFVFIFGFGNDTQYTRMFMNQFARFHTRVILYRPGITLKDIEDVIFSLPTRKINLVGFSLGAILALKFSEKHPSRIHKLLLLGIPSYSHLVFQNKRTKLKCVDLLIYLFRICPVSSIHIKRFVYKWINKNAPSSVIHTTSSYNWAHALSDLRYLLFDVDTTKLILESKNIIHVIYGKHDEFVTYGTFLDSVNDDLHLHHCEGDHHFILNESSMLANKIKYICKNHDVCCESWF